jgi:uncharacterized protein (DUF433 family)/transposase
MGVHAMIGDVAFLERPLCLMRDVDSMLLLGKGTAKRWINGYRRLGKHYPPIVRERRTGDDEVTWGEFIETALLSAYREAGLRIYHLRGVVERLREALNVRYPLAHVRPLVDLPTMKLVLDAQRSTGLDNDLWLVREFGTGQLKLAEGAHLFKVKTDFDTPTDATEAVGMRYHPLGPGTAVTIDPQQRFGQPVVRSVPTDVLAEQVRAGDPIESVATAYQLSPDEVRQAFRYAEGERAA